MEILSQKIKKKNEVKYEAKLELPKGWGSNQNTVHGEGTDIIWNNTLHLLTTPKALLMYPNFYTYKFLLDLTSPKFCGRCSRKFHLVSRWIYQTFWPKKWQEMIKDKNN